VQESDFQGGHDKDLVCQFNKEASQTREYCIANNRDASRGSPRSLSRAKRRSLGMTNLLYASANLPLLDSSEDGFDAADGAVIFGALAARRSSRW
jgi:hypothetical protein